MAELSSIRFTASVHLSAIRAKIWPAMSHVFISYARPDAALADSCRGRACVSAGLKSGATTNCRLTGPIPT